jgi:hypothetical protein
MLHAPESSEGERDRAAYILYLIGTDETLDLVAPYYVSMLSNRDYIFNDEIDSPRGHRHGGCFLLPAEDGDSLEGVTGKRMVWVKMRCPIGVLERLGRRAVPHLVRALLGDSAVDVKAHAWSLLDGITGLTIPYDIWTQTDKGVEKFLIARGWLPASYVPPMPESIGEPFPTDEVDAPLPVPPPPEFKWPRASPPKRRPSSTIPRVPPWARGSSRRRPARRCTSERSD